MKARYVKPSKSIRVGVGVVVLIDTIPNKAVIVEKVDRTIEEKV